MPRAPFSHPLCTSSPRRPLAPQPSHEELDTTGVGLAMVTNCISNHPDSSRLFADWRASHLEEVEELPIGTMVVVLPRCASKDLGWAPVLVKGISGVRFTWVHPQSLKIYKDAELGGTVRVGHTRFRNNTPPTHTLEELSTGVRRDEGILYLDARWAHSTHYSDRTKCTGHCVQMVLDTATDPERIRDIFDFATHREAGVVVCKYATHRSLSAAKVLGLVFARRIDESDAVKARCHTCCNKPLNAQNSDAIFQALRSLRTEDMPLPLSDGLGL